MPGLMVRCYNFKGRTGGSLVQEGKTLRVIKHGGKEEDGGMKEE